MSVFDQWVTTRRPGTERVMPDYGGRSGDHDRRGGKRTMTGGSTFKVQEARRHGWASLVVSGGLDVSTALTFRRMVRALKASNVNVSVDLSQLEFMDTTGARALHDVIAASRHGSWRVEVAPNMSSQASRVFALIEETDRPTHL